MTEKKKNLIFCIIIRLMPENSVKMDCVSENLARTCAADDYNHGQEPGWKLFLKSF